MQLLLLFFFSDAKLILAQTSFSSIDQQAQVTCRTDHSCYIQQTGERCIQGNTTNKQDVTSGKSRRLTPFPQNPQNLTPTINEEQLDKAEETDSLHSDATPVKFPDTESDLNKHSAYEKINCIGTDNDKARANFISVGQRLNTIHVDDSDDRRKEKESVEIKNQDFGIDNNIDKDDTTSDKNEEQLNAKYLSTKVNSEEFLNSGGSDAKCVKFDDINDWEGVECVKDLDHLCRSDSLFVNVDSVSTNSISGEISAELCTQYSASGSDDVVREVSEENSDLRQSCTQNNDSDADYSIEEEFINDVDENLGETSATLNTDISESGSISKVVFGLEFDESFVDYTDEVRDEILAVNDSEDICDKIGFKLQSEEELEVKDPANIVVDVTKRSECTNEKKGEDTGSSFCSDNEFEDCKSDEVLTEVNRVQKTLNTDSGFIYSDGKSFDVSVRNLNQGQNNTVKGDTGNTLVTLDSEDTSAVDSGNKIVVPGNKSLSVDLEDSSVDVRRLKFRQRRIDSDSSGFESFYSLDNSCLSGPPVSQASRTKKTLTWTPRILTEKRFGNSSSTSTFSSFYTAETSGTFYSARSFLLDSCDNFQTVATFQTCDSLPPRNNFQIEEEFQSFDNFHSCNNLETEEAFQSRKNTQKSGVCHESTQAQFGAKSKLSKAKNAIVRGKDFMKTKLETYAQRLPVLLKGCGVTNSSRRFCYHPCGFSCSRVVKEISGYSLNEGVGHNKEFEVNGVDTLDQETYERTSQRIDNATNLAKETERSNRNSDVNSAVNIDRASSERRTCPGVMLKRKLGGAESLRLAARELVDLTNDCDIDSEESDDEGLSFHRESGMSCAFFPHLVIVLECKMLEGDYLLLLFNPPILHKQIKFITNKHKKEWVKHTKS